MKAMPVSVSVPVPPPASDWDKRVSAAYLRIVGHTQDEAAKAVGRTPRTIRNWEQHPTWAEAQAEARSRWLAETSDAARATLAAAIKSGDAQSARWVLERTDPALEPPTAKVEHKGRLAITIEALLEQAELTDGDEV